MTAPSRSQAAWLSGDRLHLNHGPIDLIIKCEGEAAADAYAAAETRFATVLPELVDELPALRAERTALFGPVARRMAAAIAPFVPAFITPMAAVAGAVADEMIGVIAQAGARKAYVNNGGDVALLLPPDDEFVAAMPHGRIRLTAEMPVRGLATSGWRGRSWSFGIADSVTALARTAAMADAAATMIANAVDLPGHPAIERVPAHDLAPDSDLGSRPVTTAVGALTAAEVTEAVARGADFAERLRQRGLIHAAAISLAHEHRLIGETDTAPGKELHHA